MRKTNIQIVTSATLTPPDADPRDYITLEQLYNEDKITGEDLLRYIENIDRANKIHLQEAMLEMYWDEVEAGAIDDSEPSGWEW